MILLSVYCLYIYLLCVFGCLCVYLCVGLLLCQSGPSKLAPATGAEEVHSHDNSVFFLFFIPFALFLPIGSHPAGQLSVK